MTNETTPQIEELDQPDRSMTDAEIDAIGEIDIEEIVDDLRVDDLDLIEEITGAPIGGFLVEFEDWSTMRSATIRLILMIALRRHHPKATLADAGRVRMVALGEEVPADEPSEEEGDGSDPT